MDAVRARIHNMQVYIQKEERVSKGLEANHPCAFVVWKGQNQEQDLLYMYGGKQTSRLETIQNIFRTIIAHLGVALGWAIKDSLRVAQLLATAGKDFHRVAASSQTSVFTLQETALKKCLADKQAQNTKICKQISTIEQNILRLVEDKNTLTSEVNRNSKKRNALSRQHALHAKSQARSHHTQANGKQPSPVVVGMHPLETANDSDEEKIQDTADELVEGFHPVSTHASYELGRQQSIHDLSVYEKDFDTFSNASADSESETSTLVHSSSEEFEFVEKNIDNQDL